MDKKIEKQEKLFFKDKIYSSSLSQRMTLPEIQRRMLQMVTLREKNRRTVENSPTSTDVSVMEIVKKSNEIKESFYYLSRCENVCF